MKHTILPMLCLIVAIMLAGSLVSGGAQEAKAPRGIQQRIPWTTSRISGSPEPPPPYKVARSFPRLTFKNPLLLARAPGVGRFFVGEQFGKILSFPLDQECSKADLFI